MDHEHKRRPQEASSTSTPTPRSSKNSPTGAGTTRTSTSAATKEQGNINTPLELAIVNQIDRFDLAIDVIDRVPRLQATAAHLKEWLKDQIISSVNYAHENGIDRKEITDWKWPF